MTNPSFARRYDFEISNEEYEQLLEVTLEVFRRVTGQNENSTKPVLAGILKPLTPLYKRYEMFVRTEIHHLPEDVV